MSTLAFTNNAMFPTTSYVTGSTAFPYSVSVPTTTAAPVLLNDTSHVNSTDCHPIPNETYLNFSEQMYPKQELLSSYMAWGTTENILKIILTVVVFLGSVCGNLLVILVVSFNPTLRSTINYYLVNLAVADLLIAILCMWDAPVRQITYPLFVLGRTMCRIMPFSHTTCLTASVLTLTAISVDRFYAVVFPLHVRRVPHRSSIVIAAIWIFSGSVAFPMFYYRDVVVVQWKDLTEQSCVDFWPRYAYYNPEHEQCEWQRPERKLYLIVVSLFLFFLPILVMSLAYALITWKLWVSELPGERNDSATHTQNLAKKKVVKMVCIVLVAFVVCWMPLQVLVIYDLFGYNISTDGRLPLWYEDMIFWTYFLAYFNSALNPLLYGGFNQNYRQGLYNIFRRRGRRRAAICGHRTSGSLKYPTGRAYSSMDFATYDGH